MEREFLLNWPLLVEEAIRRRQGMKLTQRDLAALAKVSTPTVSRFEQAAKDVQLSSALSILDVLGLTDKRTLTFPNKEYSYDMGAGVTFWGEDSDQRVRCRIAREALDDHFSDRDKLRPPAAFQKHRTEIEALARRKYLRDQLESDKSVLIRTEEIL
jgi:transcriptional regulator with XRE-family HTH domain